MELLVILILVWAASPLALIPLAIIMGLGKKKRDSFLIELFRSGRISGTELMNLRQDSAVESESVSKSQTNHEETAAFGENKSAETQSVMSEAENAEVSAEKSVSGIYENTAIGNTASAGDTAERKISQPQEYNAEKNVSVASFEPSKIKSTSVLFGIGVTFVILAGFIFSTAIWVYLSDFARTGVIAMAAALFFGISAFAKKKLRLEGTSGAFYMLGSAFTATTFVTAGLFGLLGDWVFDNGTCTFFAITALIIAGLFHIGEKVYLKRSFTYFSLYSVMTAATLMLGQINTALDSDYEGFVLLSSFFAAALTAAYYIFKDKISAYYTSPVSVVLISARVAYGAISLPLLFEGLYEYSIASLVLCCLYLAELTAYGLLRNSKVMLSIQSIFAVGALYELTAILLEDSFGDDVTQFAFTIGVMALVLIYKHVKQLDTHFANILFMAVSLISSVSLLDYSALPLGVIAIAAFELLVLMNALEMGNVIGGFYRIFLPVPLIITAYNISDALFREYEIFTDGYEYTICGALFAAAAYACHYFSKGDRRFIPIKYSFETFIGILLLAAAGSGETVLAEILVLAVAAAAFAVIRTSDKSFHSVTVLAAFFLAISELISISADNYSTAGDISVAASMILCAVFTVISRMFYSTSLVIRKDMKVNWDVYSLGILFSVFLADSSSELFSSSARVFIILTELAVFAANLHRRRNSAGFNCTALTAAAALFSLALINRPFMVISNDVFAWKVTILIVAGFGYVSSRIWASVKKNGNGFSSAVYMLAYAMLLVDALLNETLINTLLVLCTSLAILMYSFAKKQKRWFVVSAAGLTGLTLYITKDFIGEIDWWVYLLLAGILLISIAAANEYAKGKGESVKQKAGRFFEDWQW